MDDRGSATMLLPVGLLFMVVLGAMAIDLSQVHAARADLQHRADAAASDAAAAGLDTAELRAGGAYRLDPSMVARAARRAALVRPRGGLAELQVATALEDGHRVRVQVDGTVALLFTPALPGGIDSVRLSAGATAVLDVRAPGS